MVDKLQNLNRFLKNIDIVTLEIFILNLHCLCFETGSMLYITEESSGFVLSTFFVA